MRRFGMVLLVAAGCSGGTTSPPAAPLAAGTVAPDFEAPAHDGTTVKMHALRGKPVVLYFYPKDDTPGCTAEAIAFRDGLPDFTSAGAQIVGVSLDGLDSHKAFADEYKLNFPLIVDQDGKIAKAYGVDTSKGVARRTTFVVGKDGRIAKTFAEVKVGGHDQEVLAAVKAAL